jgi:hypothetical protein
LVGTVAVLALLLAAIATFIYVNKRRRGEAETAIDKSGGDLNS